jgi:RND family efflux transporter MFP subunit
MHLTLPPQSEFESEKENSPSLSSPSEKSYEHFAGNAVQRRRAVSLAFVGALGIASGLGSGWWLAKRHFQEQAKISLGAVSEVQSTEAIPINVDRIVYRNVRRQIDAIGSVFAFEDLFIAAKTTGRVVKIHCDLADRILSGALMLEIDPTDYQLALAQTEQSLKAERARWGVGDLKASEVDISRMPLVVTSRLRADLAKSKFVRFESLLKSNSISEDDYEQSKSDFLVAESEWENQLLAAKSALASIGLREAELDSNRQKLVDSKIFAPTPSIKLSGQDEFYRVAQRMVSEGTMVRPGDNLFRLVLGQSVKVHLRLQERHSRSVLKGQQVEIDVSSEDDRVQGVVDRISPIIDPLTRTFIVEVLVANDELKLKPGGFVKARIFTGQEERVPTVPVIAVDSFAGLNKIFKIEDEKATEHLVRLGIQNDDWVEIAEPLLQDGVYVATSAQRMLSTGTKVRIKNALDSQEMPSTGRTSLQETNPITEP